MSIVKFSKCHLEALIVAWLFLGTGVAQCYYPGALIAPDQYPCNKYAYISNCCPLGYTCFSNGLCVVTDHTVAQSPLNTALRGTCTNPLWNNEICGDFCLNDGKNGGLQSCGNGKWCCNVEATSGSCDCAKDIGTFSIRSGVAQTIVGVSSLLSTSTNFASPSSTSIGSLSAATSSKSTSRTSVISRTSTNQTILGTTTSTLTLSQSPTASQISVTQTSAASAVAITQTSKFKVGISVGIVALAAIIAGLIGFCIWYKRRRQRHEDGPPTPPYQKYRASYQENHGRLVSPMSDVQDLNRTPLHSPSPVSRGISANSGFTNFGGGRFSPPIYNPNVRPYEGT